MNLQVTKWALNQFIRSNRVYLTLNTYFKIISLLDNNNLQSLNILIVNNKFSLSLIANLY